MTLGRNIAPGNKKLGFCRYTPGLHFNAFEQHVADTSFNCLAISVINDLKSSASRGLRHPLIEGLPFQHPESLNSNTISIPSSLTSDFYL